MRLTDQLPFVEQSLRPTILFIVGVDCSSGEAAVFVAAALESGHRVCVATVDSPDGALAELLDSCETFLPKRRLWTIRPGGAGWDLLPAQPSIVVMTNRESASGASRPGAVTQEADVQDVLASVDRRLEVLR